MFVVTTQVQRTFATNLPVLQCNLLDKIAEMARDKCVAPFVDDSCPKTASLV